MILGKVLSTGFDNLIRRVVKFTGYGLSDTKETIEISSFGIDTNPIKGMVAVYSNTNDQGVKVVVGYMNKNQLSGPGESRVYSVDSDGGLKAFVFCKSDGKLQLNGSVDNAVRYTPLNNGVQDFKTGIQAELVKIQTAITGLGGVYTPGTLTVDIADSKIDTVLVP